MARRAKRGTTVAAVAALLVVATVIAPSPAAAAKRLPQIDHVFVIWLENENADVTFDPSGPAPYLAKKLPKRGLYMPNYYGIGHFSLDNYIAVVSGQAPNIQTQADCQAFTEFVPAVATTDGQFIGTGCVYPSKVQTVANQLEDAGLSWRGYMEDMAAKAPSDKPSERAACRHPALGAVDDTQSAEVGDQYATRHNPFMYFHSIIDDVRSCRQHDVDLAKLARHLKRRKRVASYNFITPNLCNDGHDAPCVNGDPGGLEQANGWLRRQVPKILRSGAYKHHGLLMISFDEAEAEGGGADSSACCGELAGPNTPSPGGLHPGPGGGRIGAVLLSPCIRPGTTTDVAYNHYSFLRSVEDNFGLRHLGMAARPDLVPFGRDVLNRPSCGEKIRLARAGSKRLGSGRAKIRFRVRAPLARCRRHVTITFAGKSTRTNRKGRAAIVTGARHGTARARKHGCRSDRLTLKRA